MVKINYSHSVHTTNNKENENPLSNLKIEPTFEQQKTHRVGSEVLKDSGHRHHYGDEEDFHEYDSIDQTDDSAPYAVSYVSKNSQNIPRTDISSSLCGNFGLNLQEINKILDAIQPNKHLLESTPHQIFTHQSHNKEFYSQLLTVVESQIGRDNLLLVKKIIEEHGIASFEKVVKDKSALVIDINQEISILFKTSGKIYLQIKELGRGEFKVTKKTLLIASTKIDHLVKNQLTFRAFSTPLNLSKTHINPDILTRKKIQQIENNMIEKRINSYLKEASKTQKLSHVNMIKSVMPMGELFGMMNELFDCDVNKALESETLSPEERLTIAIQVAEGISELHHIGVVHRDIKPDNLLFKWDEEGKVVAKIADFGLSTGFGILRNANRGLYSLTKDPYLIKNEVNSIFSPALDIYQLGMTLTMILTQTTLEKFDQMRIQDHRKNGLSNQSEWKMQHDWKMHPEQWEIMKKIEDVETKKFLLKMLNPLSQKDRPDIGEVVAFLKTKIIPQTQ